MFHIFLFLRIFLPWSGVLFTSRWLSRVWMLRIRCHEGAPSAVRASIVRRLAWHVIFMIVFPRFFDGPPTVLTVGEPRFAMNRQAWVIPRHSINYPNVVKGPFQWSLSEYLNSVIFFSFFNVEMSGLLVPVYVVKLSSAHTISIDKGNVLHPIWVIFCFINNDIHRPAPSPVRVCPSSYSLKRIWLRIYALTTPASEFYFHSIWFAQEWKKVISFYTRKCVDENIIPCQFICRTDRVRFQCDIRFF